MTKTPACVSLSRLNFNYIKSTDEDSQTTKEFHVSDVKRIVNDNTIKEEQTL